MRARRWGRVAMGSGLGLMLASGCALLAADVLGAALTRSGDPAALLAALASAGAVGLSAWLCLGVALAFLAALPGRLGVLCAAASARACPAALRRAIAVSVGIGIAGLSAAPAHAVSAATATAVVRASLAAAAPSSEPGPSPAFTPTTPPQQVAVPAPAGLVPPALTPAFVPTAPARPTPTVAPAGPLTAPVRERADGEVVVRRGDTLWDIAGRWLGPTASVEQIARTWPAWYAANRAVIGPDPHHITPGQRLVAPTGVLR